MSVIDISGLPGVSIHSSFVARREWLAPTACQIGGRVDQRDGDAGAVDESCAAADRCRRRYRCQPRRGRRARAASSRNAWPPCPRQTPAHRMPAFERRERGLERLPRGVAAARVVEFAPLAGSGLHKRAGQMNGRHDGAGRRVGLVGRRGSHGCGIAWLTPFPGLWARSAIRSSGFSMPHARRIILS